MMAVETSGSWRFTGRMALGLFLGFFAIVFAVNGVMLTMALKTHSGIVANEPYRKGLKYNERIAADAMQSELGWMSDIGVSPDARRLVVKLTGKSGEAIDGMQVRAEVARPSSSRGELHLVLEPKGPGYYEAELPEIENGAYIANLSVGAARDDAEAVYRARRRLWIKR